MDIVDQAKSYPVEDNLIAIFKNVGDLIDMVECEQPCIPILYKIISIQHQLQELKAVLLFRHTKKSIFAIQKNSEVSVQLRELALLRDLYGEKI